MNIYSFIRHYKMFSKILASYWIFFLFLPPSLALGKFYLFSVEVYIQAFNPFLYQTDLLLIDSSFYILDMYLLLDLGFTISYLLFIGLSFCIHKFLTSVINSFYLLIKKFCLLQVHDELLPILFPESFFFSYLNL